MRAAPGNVPSSEPGADEPSARARDPPASDSSAPSARRNSRSASSAAPRPGARGSRRAHLATLSVVLVAAGIVAAYFLIGGLGTRSGATPNVLIPKGTYYSIPGGQFSYVSFKADSGGNVVGEMWNTWGINVYVMTPAEDFHLAETGMVSGYLWASGRIANLTTTNLSVSVPSGSWDLVFLNTDGATMNPVWTNTTIVGFYSDVTIGGA